MENTNLKTTYRVEEKHSFHVYDNGVETLYHLNKEKTGLSLTYIYDCPLSSTVFTIPSIIRTEDDENEVIEIGRYIFYPISRNYSNIQKIVIPDSIEYIHPNAFDKAPDKLKQIQLSDLSLLKDVKLPEGVEVITESYTTFDLRPSFAFQIVYDSGFHLLFCQDSDEEVSLCDFDNPTNPLHLVIPKKVIGNDDDEYAVTKLERGCFQCCYHLESAVIPDSVHTICEEAFDSTGLSYVAIPDSVQTIAQDAFSCTKLGSFLLPKNVINVDAPILANCDQLTVITVAKDNPIYDSRNDCNAIIETASNKLIQGCPKTIIPNTVTAIDAYAFFCCSIKTITIPDSVKFIGHGAFRLCKELEEIVICDASLLKDAEVPEGVAVITPEEKKRAVGNILSMLGAK